MHIKYRYIKKVCNDKTPLEFLKKTNFQWSCLKLLWYNVKFTSQNHYLRGSGLTRVGGGGVSISSKSPQGAVEINQASIKLNGLHIEIKDTLRRKREIRFSEHWLRVHRLTTADASWRKLFYCFSWLIAWPECAQRRSKTKQCSHKYHIIFEFGDVHVCSQVLSRINIYTVA